MGKPRTAEALSNSNTSGMFNTNSISSDKIISFCSCLFDGGKDAVASLKESWWFGISPEGFGTIAMIVNFATAFIVKSFTPAPPSDVQDIVENIRIPSGAGEATH